MFENQTFEEIMERMLERISDEIDKRENSVIWNALAPAAAELALSYIWLDQVLNLVYADTAEGEYLDRRAAEAGLERYQASKAIWSAAFTDGVSVPPGTRFFLEDLYFTMLEDGKLECETAGTKGNANLSGRPLLPLDTIPGLEKAVMGSLEIPGRDEETDESDALQTMGRRSGRRGQSEGLSAVEWRGNRKGCHYKRENGTCL